MTFSFGQECHLLACLLLLSNNHLTRGQVLVANNWDLHASAIVILGEGVGRPI